ncbi:TAT-variant-translocated molybdopterin oxidoreductase [Gimesia fumaroli]|uniref:Tetrathionate reductase subunit B n=1 Tax=Gimesia fumaroli TaxID=2527976 RepID=A0A518IKK6_9PLAN|nr:TAT-variant-translocated molybdopterin oxidoreductase [Gimesia fumaroli]QDV53604.1 Tetrathionate reductase subunit B precursor [Gimesia fumaroli]
MDKKYWRSLGELHSTPEFEEILHREFPVAASEYPEGVSRRRWMQLMGASVALAGVSGCRWEDEKISPSVSRPEGLIPGKPQKYATLMELGGLAESLLVTCFDGRPIKVEGNPDSPQSKGSSTVFAQSETLSLYDPDRAVGVIERKGGARYIRDWQAFIEYSDTVLGQAQKDGGAKLRVLADVSSSAARKNLQEKFSALYPKSRWYDYTANSRDNVYEGARIAFGEVVRPHFDLTKANVVVCLDEDLLSEHPASLLHTRDWASRRDPAAGPMNRLYAVESRFTTTGAAADHRLPTRSVDLGYFLTKLEEQVQQRLSEKHAKAEGDEYSAKVLAAMSEDLVANQGSGLIAIGASQPAELHARVHKLNEQLGNVGEAVRYTKEPLAREMSAVEALRTLTEEMQSGAVEALVILGGNPAYNAPGDIDFVSALGKVPNSIHLGEYEDETSLLCQWHLPKTHPFEQWGDSRAYDGTLCVAQPLIEPLHDGKSEVELLAILCGDKHPVALDLIKEAVKGSLDSMAVNASWRRLVHDGLLKGSSLEAVSPKVKELPAPKIVETASEETELVFYLSPQLYDGRFANSGWLQETPDNLTKITWDNAALIAPKTAKDLGVGFGSVVKLILDGKSIELPVYVLPGQAPNSIAVALGYGRTAAGLVGGDVARDVKPVGENMAALQSKAAMNFAAGLKVEKTGKEYELAITQDHHAIDAVGANEIEGRVGQLVREGDLSEYENNPGFAKERTHHPPLVSLWDKNEEGKPNYQELSYEGQAWGMSIDLTKCIGCNACMVSCQAENNVPVVGREQVINSREMHWLRVDRYFTGDDENNPGVAVQPMLCQQCELAPCEQVCPVAATVHTDEGLNDMVYNRCVGTRYCANNCPYKVRRFNYFNFNKVYEEPRGKLQALVLNPEVTVRHRGVMEKCTYCVQRIKAVQIEAKNDQRPIEDGEIVTACQQACSAKAIEFGDLTKENSKVAQAHANPRSYTALSELNIKPRTAYLARITNPHPSLAKPASEGHGHGHGDEHAEAGTKKKTEAH